MHLSCPHDIDGNTTGRVLLNKCGRCPSRRHTIGRVDTACPARSFTFDLLFLNDESTAQLPLIERKERLQRLFKKVPAPGLQRPNP